MFSSCCEDSSVDGWKTLLEKTNQNSWVLHVYEVNQTLKKPIQPERTSPDEGYRVQWPKRRELSSQQDEDKSPNNYSNNTIPSSTKLRKKLPSNMFGWLQIAMHDE